MLMSYISVFENILMSYPKEDKNRNWNYKYLSWEDISHRIIRLAFVIDLYYELFLFYYPKRQMEIFSQLP